MNIAQNWRMNGQRYALKGKHCATCGSYQATQREVCPQCEAKHAQPFTFAEPIILVLPTTESVELRHAAR